MPIHDFTARLGSGEDRPLSAYRGRTLLVVNVASKCGFTPQYRGLQALQDRFAPHGFDVLAFPCNQFGGQEPGSDAEIAAFCARGFAVSFPLFAKIDVNGPSAHPLYVWLKRQQPGLLGGRILWNFTKFLVDGSGEVRGRFAPTTPPESLADRIAGLLARHPAPA